MWTRRELKSNAKILMKANYWKAVVVSIVLGILLGSGAGSAQSTTSGSKDELNEVFANYSTETVAMFFIAVAGIFAVAFIIHFVLKLFVWNILEVGCQKFFLNCSGEDAKVKDIFYGFKNGYGCAIAVMFLRSLFIFLWSLLLIIPGIIKSYEYRMVPYILADNPGLTSREVYAKSKEMMRGQKWNAFVLDLSFLGWNILGVITFGIVSVFYVAPYQNLTNAQLYNTLKNN